MCKVCDYIIFRLQQEFDLAMSRLERDKVDTLGSLLADAHIAKWEQKEGVAYQPDDAEEKQTEADEEIYNREYYCQGCGGVLGPEYSTCICDDPDEED